MAADRWHLRDSEAEICVPDVEATAEEMRVVVEAANAKQPDTAPHYATSVDGDERVESEESMDIDAVDAALESVGSDA